LPSPTSFPTCARQVPGMTVVTRDVDDCALAGVPILDPWA
jgi:hypothetical protein